MRPKVTERREPVHGAPAEERPTGTMLLRAPAQQTNRDPGHQSGRDPSASRKRGLTVRTTCHQCKSHVTSEGGYAMSRRADNA